jgi:hypothetical protein
MTHKEENLRLDAAKDSVDFDFVATASSWRGDLLLVTFCDDGGEPLGSVLVDSSLVVTEP